MWIDWDYGVAKWRGRRTFSSITDDGGNTYQQLDIEHGYYGPAPGGLDTTRLYWAINGSAGTRTVTFSVDNPNNEGTFIGSSVAEYSGADHPNQPVDDVTWKLYSASSDNNVDESIDQRRRRHPGRDDRRCPWRGAG